ncbi:hypothetical protein AcW2_005009 [Taiwanofungus camphoratus]|nr:hypothetical protein AcW2_005009 [Antrodia cinnamomea]
MNAIRLPGLARPTHNPPERPRRSVAVIQANERDVSAAGIRSSSQSQHSLPSIHQLHPDLPPAGPQPSSAIAGASYVRQQSVGYPVASGSSLGSRPAPDESDPEFGDQQEPPKKKRRRQALSCTECKRRKIKCDRAQPCGPCVRRGEHHKCQWHIIEPMEKYVTRTEYDELKAKVFELEAMVKHTAMPARLNMHSSAVPMAPGPPVDSVQGTAIMPYHHTTSCPPTYHTTMANIRSSHHGESSMSSNRPLQLAAIHSPTSSSRPPTSHGSPTHSVSMAVSPVDPGPSSASPPASDLVTAPEPSRSAIASSRRASLSLAAITTPFTPDSHPHSQSKKYSAQTPTLQGQRLRQVSVPSGSVQVV